MDRRRVLLVDQNDDFLDGLSALIAEDPGLEVAGRAHSGIEAIERARDLRPDLVLMDVALPDMSGFDAVPWLKRQQPSPLVLLATFHQSRVAELAAMKVGADACVSKTALPDHLLLMLQELLFPEDIPER
ncbi:MAG TPA: response regulator transcription factor [Candidatus Polarisedimenticolaceae bacterium]|nr:response regulator transcription factor [Candidatus Polarisedimenticolaceae bacterium]